MAFASSNPQTYITQWLETATKGTVVPEFSLFNNRMRLRCLKCKQTLTVIRPEGTTIDYGIQQFVTLHAHKVGSWVCYQCCKEVTVGITEHAADCVPIEQKKPIPVTGDFKQVGKIDLNPEKEAKIKQVADNISKEYAAKLDDNAIAAKIKELQQADVGKPVPISDPAYFDGLTPSKTGWLPKATSPSGLPVQDDWPDEEATDIELAEMEKTVAKQKAIENALKIKMLQAQLQDLQKVTQHVKINPTKVPPTTPAGPDAVMVTGRKFR